MPRVAGQDTPAQREAAVMTQVGRRLDALGATSTDARDRVVTWIDGLVDGTADHSEEIRTMKAVASQFQGLDPASRERVVRWVNEVYGATDAQGNTDNGDGPRPL